MKYLLFPFLIIAFAQKPTMAQVPKDMFTLHINALESYIRQKNATVEIEEFQKLTTLMNTQIGYLNAQVNAMSASYSADTAKAHADQKSAYASSGQDAATKTAAARSEQMQANLLVLSIMPYKNNLLTDNTLYNEIEPLKASIYASRVTLLNYLTQFAATLQ